jgi:hypothetical protein
MATQVTVKTLTMTTTGTPRDFQELECILDRYLEEDKHTSGDNPAWHFILEMHEAIRYAIARRAQEEIPH